MDFKGPRRFSKPLLSTTQPPLREAVQKLSLGWYHKLRDGARLFRRVFPVPESGDSSAGAPAPSQNENAHPGVSILRLPVLRQGDVHGRIRFDGFATAKTYVIAILGRARNEVKEKTSAPNSTPKPLPPKGLNLACVFCRLWKNCYKPVDGAIGSGLTARNVEAYLSPR